MTKIVIVGVAILALGGLFIWSPWITAESAGEKALAAYTKTMEDVVDGCGFDCDDCGVTNVEKSLTGYSVALTVGCSFTAGPGQGTTSINMFVPVLGSAKQVE